jgi:putative inorganic carbon (HCO3(-)) transporter
MGTIDNLDGNHANRLMGAMSINAAGTPRQTSRRGHLGGAYVALLLFLFVYCARPEDWIPGLSRAPLAKITGIIAFLAFLFSLPSIRQRFPRELFYLALLLGQLSLASVWSPVWRGGALQTTMDFAKVLIAVVVMAAAVDTLGGLRLLILTQAASVATIAAVTVWRGHFTLGRLGGMLGGSYSDPNDLALAFVISLPLCLALLLLTRSWILKAAWTLAIVVLADATFLTGSRGGFLALLVTGAVCLWQFAIRGRRPSLLGFAALLTVILGLFSSGILVGRLKGTFDIKDDTAVAYASAQAREKLFWRSVQVTKEHPLLGVGPGNFAQVSGSWHVAHNSFTQMSAEGGIPALFLYVLILWRGFRNLRAAKRFANRRKEAFLLVKALHASLIGYVIGSFFLSVNYTFFPYFLVAYTTALFLIGRKGNPDENRDYRFQHIPAVVRS